MEYWVGLGCSWIGLEEGRKEECEIQAYVSEKLEVSLNFSDFRSLPFDYVMLRP
jgi:hypothetical protein